jgi:fibrillarin-like rRNA methylase
MHQLAAKRCHKLEKVDKFSLKQMWLCMNADERKAFAADAGSTVHYIKTHTVRATKVPRQAFMDQLVKAVRKRKPEITKEQVIEYFYR